MLNNIVDALIEQVQTSLIYMWFKSPETSAFDVDSCNSCESMEYKSACLNKNATAQDLMIVLLREFCLEMHSCQSIRNIIV